MSRPVRAPRVRPPRTASRASAVLGAVAATAACAVVAGCAGSSEPASAPPATSPAQSTVTSAATPAEAVDDASTRAARAIGSTSTARYSLTTTDGTTAQVVVARDGRKLRLDLVHGERTDSLLLTADGTAVSCHAAAQPSRRLSTCLRLAGPGQPLPPLLDPGLERVVTASLTYLAAGVATARPASSLPAASALPAAQCYDVTGIGQDAGTYCLSVDGLLRRAVFPSGTLDLVSVGTPPAAATFAPPVRPTPLPTPSSS
ncbi:MAG: hypothetical protein ACTHQ3_15120 [Motilibacteraceae bacterium]